MVRVMGGVTTWGVLVSATSRGAVETALDTGEITRIARGRYSLPAADEALVLAARTHGVVCLTSAALSLGWAVKTVPDPPHIALPKHRRLSAELRAAVAPYWIDLGPDDIRGLGTTETRTLEMCGRTLPFDEALAIADSALREGYPTAALRELAELARGPGSAQLRRVAACADPRAANPFESVLRAIALDVDGLRVTPQVPLRTVLGTHARPDLVDDDLRIVIEADSFEWHGDRAALRRDARRYDALAVSGWLVLRFAWEDVMHDPDWVRRVLQAATDRRTDRLVG